MTDVIDLEESRLLLAVKRGYRNWVSRFKEEFGLDTRLPEISTQALSHLAHGKDKGTFYLYDLIMNLHGLGSGFEFNDLRPKEKMWVIDQFLFLLDRIRFECMKRLGWLKDYPGEDLSLVELITGYDQLAPNLQANIPSLSREHPDYERFRRMNRLDQEAHIRKMIPKALKEIARQSTTL
jgi:hypothetical protein